MKSGYQETYDRWWRDPERFWAEAAEAIDWERKWDRVLDDTRAPFYRWFAGGVLNTCFNALDVHVDRGRGERVALIYDSPVTGTVRSYTYRELRDEVARFAGALADHGVGKGDRVIVYMPMVPEAVVAMLACARIGAVHSVVFGGFAADELAARILATVVKRLPKTRSGKIVRGTIKKIADGATYQVPPTIDDPAILDEIKADLASIGYPKA